MTRTTFKTTFLGMLLVVTTTHSGLAMTANEPQCDNGCEVVDFDQLASTAVRYDDAAHAARVNADLRARIANKEKLGTDAFPSTLIGRQFTVGPRTNPWSVADYVRRELAYAGHQDLPSHAEIARVIAAANPGARNINRGIYIDGDTLKVPSMSAFVQGTDATKADAEHQTWQASLREEVGALEAAQAADAAAVSDTDTDTGTAPASGGLFGLEKVGEKLGDWWRRLGERSQEERANKAATAKSAVPAASNSPAQPDPAPAPGPAPAPAPTAVAEAPAPAPAPAASEGMTQAKVQAEYARLRRVEQERALLDRRLAQMKRDLPGLESKAKASLQVAQEAKQQWIAADVADQDGSFVGTLFTSPSALFRDTEKAKKKADETWDIYIAQNNRVYETKQRIAQLTTERAALNQSLGEAAD